MHGRERKNLIKLGGTEITVFLARFLVPPDQDFHKDEIGLLWQFLYEGKS